MPFMKGLMPIRRTFYYLEKGDIFLRSQVRIVLMAYHPTKKNSEGARDFVFWHWAQLQHKNPYVQLVKSMKDWPVPYVRAFLDDGKDVVMDIENYDRQQVHDRIQKVIGKNENMLVREHMMQAKIDNPANFGDTYPRQCICEMAGQVPCPSILPLPKYLRGKWRWNKNLP
ncbi:unnamed protein product [Soboliphyme baturini]|uniref:Small ribosomal subunit protein mS25 n=1 Tax=Soboliphyme baturini TaxID=241478 RepID=A0A183IBI7_9BILA|nr:unnamed protein product [Soboliphyme baturini]